MTKQIIGTLKAKNSSTVEYVKKCQSCGGTLLVLKSEVFKTTHDLCR